MDLFKYPQRNFLPRNVTGSGNGLMPSDNKPLPELMFYPDLFHHMVSPGHNELIHWGLMTLMRNKSLHQISLYTDKKKRQLLSSSVTHCGPVSHICLWKRGHNCFRDWLIVHSMPRKNNIQFDIYIHSRRHLRLRWNEIYSIHVTQQGAVSIRKTVLPGMAIPMLKIRRPNGRLIFNMEIAIRR